MLTTQSLKELGVDIESGLGRCLNNEAFYIKMVGMALDNDAYGKLREAVEAGDLEAGFEAAHALKGMLGNVSLTNILDPVLEMTEALRAREERDYAPLLDKMDEELAKVKALRE